MTSLTWNLLNIIFYVCLHIYSQIYIHVRHVSLYKLSYISSYIHFYILCAVMEVVITLFQPEAVYFD